MDPKAFFNRLELLHLTSEIAADLIPRTNGNYVKLVTANIGAVIMHLVCNLL